MYNRTERYNLLKSLLPETAETKTFLNYIRMYRIDFIIFYGKPTFLCSQISKARCNKPSDFEKRFLVKADKDLLEETVIVSLGGFELKEFRREWTIQVGSDLPHKDYKLLICDWRAAYMYLKSHPNTDETIVLFNSNKELQLVDDCTKIDTSTEPKQGNLEIPSYPWKGQTWYVGRDLSVLAGRTNNHFKDFPRSLNRQGITEGYLKLTGDDLAQFKKIVLESTPDLIDKYRSSSALFICNFDIACLYLQKHSKQSVEIKPDKEKEYNLVPEPEPEPEPQLKDTVIDANPDLVLHNTVITPEFKEYINRYNLDYVVWNFQPWFIGSALSKALEKDKFHFNFFGNQNRGNADLKCLLLRGPLLEQFKQAAISKQTNIIEDYKFYTALYICNWKAAYKYLKDYANAEILEQPKSFNKKLVFEHLHELKQKIASLSLNLDSAYSHLEMFLDD